jgi:glucosylceramidase
MKMRGSVLAIGCGVLCLVSCGGGGNNGGGNNPPPAQQAATPTFSPAGGIFTTIQSVSLSTTTAGASIYYTTDGSTPTNGSTLYSAATPIQVAVTTTINAIAADAPAYLNSNVATATYTINLPAAATPAFSPAPGTYTSAQSVTLSDTTAGAAIYYTTDGSTPTRKSTLYTAGTPIAVSATTTINAIATASGFSNSAVATGTYTINLPAAATPTFSPAPGTYNSGQSVSLSTTTNGASIYYTTDGSTPTAKSNPFTPGTPISVSATTTINAIATATGFSTSAVSTGTYTLNGPAVSVVLSTDDKTQLMAAQPTIHFGLGSTVDAKTNTVVVDPAQTYQSIEGFGAAFTDSAADLLMKVEPAASLPGTLNDLFTTNGDGIGLSFMRIPMGGSDIALSVYSYDDQPVGATDLTLANFSIAHDQAYILPLIKQAKALNPQMKLMANPWSPPGWMKDPTSMSPVSMLGGTLLATPQNETAFANYFVKFIQAYMAAGVTIDYVSLQNEPLNITTSYPSMGMSDAQQLSLLQNHVLPEFTINNIITKVLVYDHNWDTPSYPQTVLGGLTQIQLQQQIAGTAWHGYGGATGAQQLLQNQFPDLGNWETEHSGGTWQADQFTTDILEITHVLRNSGKSFVKWSLALDETLGPNLSENVPGLGGCNTCTPIVTVNSKTGAVTKDIEFYTLGQYSKYVLPGAVRVYSSNTPAIASVAFQNTDGSMALVASNATTTSQTFQVQWGNQSFSYTLPGTSIATFTWNGAETGTIPPVAATAQIQGSSFSSESGLQTESTTDSTGEYDLGYLGQGSWAVYENVDFGNSVSQVSVRTASGGNGGTATFYLDNMTSNPIATVNLPVTGGWQTWSTVNATVAGASGKHKLYVVFSGTTASISNVNWFQFQ